MVINGIELDFDLYDVDNAGKRNRYFEELKKMRNIVQDMPKKKGEEQARYICRRVKGLFDSVFGAGTGDAVCGEKENILTCMRAYEELLSDQMRQDARYEMIMQGIRRSGKRKRR